ncbi:hypothetical protein [Arthrobacter sp. CJ23]|uniref:hypothetical protein n=1 Tax=Arthrobacter sp. CJ23 TaxID=2972479 RepID=UPI0037C075C3
MEIGDRTRFTASPSVPYLGLVPSDISSGQSRHQARSRKPRTAMPANSWSKPPRSTNAHTPARGNGCCASSTLSPGNPYP